MINIQESPVKASGTGTVRLPPGMTQEEADRLVREADERSQDRKEID